MLKLEVEGIGEMGKPMRSLATLFAVVFAAALCLWLPGCRSQEAAPGAGGPGEGGPPSAGGEGRGGPRREMSEAERAQRRAEMLERMLEEAGLTEEEKAAVTEAAQAKNEARQALEEELTALRRVANSSNPSEAQLAEALAAYQKAVSAYRGQVAAADQALMEQLPIESQVRCMSLGILDNGLGRMGMPGGGRESGDERGSGGGQGESGR